MRRKIVVGIALLLLVAGLGVLLYPHVMQQLYRQYARRVIADFETRLEHYRRLPQSHGEGAPSSFDGSGSEGSLHWIYQLMVEYNRHLYETGQAELVDPFSYEQVDFSLRQFGFDEEMIGYITIPRMEVELPIFLGANDPNMDRGAAHMTQTSLTVGGINTNSVLAAHRGMSTAAMFRDIHLLEIGDEIIITNFYQTLYYQVVEMRIIFPDQVETILIQSGRDLITLVSCHPLRHNFQRYIVFAERVR